MINCDKSRLSSINKFKVTLFTKNVANMYIYLPKSIFSFLLLLLMLILEISFELRVILKSDLDVFILDNSFWVLYLRKSHNFSFSSVYITFKSLTKRSNK